MFFRITPYNGKGGNEVNTALERRQEILSLLNLRRHETLDNLAFEFGVSKRTIRYDIEALSFRYPIYTTQGNGGGIHMIDGATVGGKYLNDGQAELLQRLVETLNADDQATMQSILKTFAVPKKGKRRN